MNDPIELGNGLATMIPFVKEHTPDHLLWVYRRNAALLLVSFGVVQAGSLVETFGDVVCVLLGGCDG